MRYISGACWRFMFAFWQTFGYFNIFSNKSQQKNDQKEFIEEILSFLLTMDYTDCA